MTTIANVTLNSVIYSPSERQGTTGFIWTDRTGDYPNGWGQLNYSGPVSKGGAVKRVGFKLTFPKVVTADSACGCDGDMANNSAVTIYVDVDTRQTSTQLADLLARIKSLVSTTVFENAVLTQEGVYG